MKLLLATLLILSAPAFGSHKHSTLKKFLNDSTWCFADQEGPRQGGRIHFKKIRQQGLYDVVDAPGSGGIPLGWNTVEELFYDLVLIQFASGMNPLRQWAEVQIVSENEMLWTFTSTDGSKSTLRRCSK